MDRRANAYTRALKEHDSQLLCRKNPYGVYTVYRKGTHWAQYKVGDNTLVVSHPVENYVLTLSDDWSVTGTPVEWGLEPLLSKIKESDFHRNGVLLADKLREEREYQERLKQRATQNEFRALAADMRRDFAKATNDIVVRK